jgi:hypothetical protein
VSEYRDFDAARHERDRQTKPIRFRLGGEEFALLPRPTLFDIFELAAAPDPKEARNPQERQAAETAAVRAITEFVERMMPNQRAVRRWRKLLARRTDIIDGPSIVDLGEWLAEEYSGRPSAPSSDSAPGRPTHGANTKEERFTPESGSQT